MRLHGQFGWFRFSKSTNPWLLNNTPGGPKSRVDAKKPEVLAARNQFVSLTDSFGPEQLLRGPSVALRL